MLNTIINILTELFNMAKGVVTSLVDVVSFLPTALTYLTGGIAAMPNFMIGIATLTITIAIVYVVVGREGGVN